MNTIADRLLLLRGKIKQGDLANTLKINPNTLRSYENGRSSPNQEFLERICVHFSVSAEWLLLGRGSMYTGALPQPIKTELEPTCCARCAKLETELEEEHRERRSQSAELREVNAENRRLAYENGTLRERCATLDERVKHCASEGDFSKQLNILFNNEFSGE